MAVAFRVISGLPAALNAPLLGARQVTFDAELISAHEFERFSAVSRLCRLALKAWTVLEQGAGGSKMLGSHRPSVSNLTGSMGLERATKRKGYNYYLLII